MTLTVILLLTAAFVTIAILMYVMWEKMKEMKRDATYLDDRVGRNADTAISRIGVILDRLRLLKASMDKPDDTAEKLVKALGGTVHKCYDEDGKLKEVRVSAPWLDEDVSSNHFFSFMSKAPISSTPSCEEALSELVLQIITKPVTKVAPKPATKKAKAQRERERMEKGRADHGIY